MNFFSRLSLITIALFSSSLFLQGCIEENEKMLTLKNYSKKIPGINDTEQTVQIPITVLDGYIGKAVVCADFDYNFICDSNVEQQITDENGSVVLNVKEFIYNSFVTHHVLVTVTEEDSTNKHGNQIYKINTDIVMMSDTVKDRDNFITPYTVLAQCYVENGSAITKQEAISLMAQSLGAKDLELTTDYTQRNMLVLIAAELIVKTKMLPTSNEGIQDTQHTLKEIIGMLKKIRKEGTKLINEGYTTDEIIDKLYTDIFSFKISNQRPFVSFKPQINFTTIKFINDSYDLDSDELFYKWDFGNGKTSLLKNPEITYDKPGNYKVSLTVSDSENDVTTTKYITVSEYIECYPVRPNFSCYTAENTLFCQTDDFDTSLCSRLHNSPSEQLVYIFKHEDQTVQGKFASFEIPKDANTIEVELTVTDGFKKESSKKKITPRRYE